MHTALPLATPRYALILLALLILFIPLPAWSGIQSQEIPMQHHAGYFREKCLQLNVAQQIHYSVKTSHTVEFNIHHHSETDTFYPVKHQLREFTEDTLDVGADGEYCFMWTNISDAGIDYTIILEYEVLDRKKLTLNSY